MTLFRATIAWQVYDITGSAFHLGLVGLVQFAPALVFSMVGGATADAYDRKRIVIGFQIVPALCSVSLAVANLGEQAGLGLLYATVVIVAIASAFENPARSAFLPQLIERERFQSAVIVHSAVQTGAFLTGPVLMGFVVAAWGLAVPYVIHGGLVVVSIVAMTAVRPRFAAKRGRAPSWAAIREGLSFVRHQPVVLGCMTLDMFAVLFGGAVALLPVYATDILGVGARGYGLLSASLETGAALMAICLIALPPIRRTGASLMWAVLAFGVATIVFGLSRSFPLSLVAYMAAGMADYVSMVMRGTAIQLSTPDELRGRVSAVNLIFIGASNQLGAAESGFVAALTSPTFSVVSGGIGALVVLAIVAATNPILRRYRATG